MADQFDEIMNKHFEAAGIKEDQPAVEENAEQNNQVEANKEEKTSDAFEAAIDRASGEGKQSEPEKNEQSAKEGEQPAGDKQDKPGDGNDGKPQQGKKEEGQSVGNPNDLTLQDGTVVKAGAERRWYETARIRAQEASQAKQEANTWKQKYETAQTRLTAMQEAAQQVGVEDPTQMQAAIRLYRDLRNDPVAVVKQLLVDIKGAGYSIDGIGSGVDTQALLNAINQLKPAQTATTVEQRQEQILEDVKEKVQTFFKDNPDAVLHEGVIAAVLEKHPDATLEDAYLAVKTQAIEQGFDWSKPLGPQVEARKQQQTQQQPTQTQNQNKPIVEGKVLNGNAVDHDPNKTVQADSFEDAIRAGMRDAGLTVQ